MHPDIIELRAFYDTTLGHVTERAIRMAVSALWERVAGERLVGMGYCLPYLDRFSADTERTFAFMPAGQGAVAWPTPEKSATALVFDEELPLPDSSIDRVLMVHALEYAENAPETLKEVWRVLAPNGRLVIVVPNRRGVWARLEHTPFGSGRPYSRGQLTALLREANFTVNTVSDALHFPPATRRWMMRPCLALEGMGRRLWPLFSGVLVIEAQKRLYQGLPVARRASRRVFVPVLAPQATPAGSVRKTSQKPDTKKIFPASQPENCKKHQGIAPQKTRFFSTSKPWRFMSQWGLPHYATTFFWRSQNHDQSTKPLPSPAQGRSA